MTKENKGLLIVIEGVDGSGKETQSDKLYNRLLQESFKVKRVEYPNYKSDSSAVVKMYLNGDFGDKPEDVSPYVASSFYAIDRYASYKKEWEDFYMSGGIVIADRYTTANMVHQASKIKDNSEKEKFISWLWDFEFNMYGLPVPDCIIFLDMPPQYSKKLIENRDNKYTGEKAKDIHEKNYEYIIDSYNNAKAVAKNYNWNIIHCVESDRVKGIDEIHEEVYNCVLKLINTKFK